MTKDEALKLALEALTHLQPNALTSFYTIGNRDKAIKAIREALAQPETVSPGGGLVPAVPVAVYGYCPVCGGAGVMRERRPNGDDKCTNGHKYPSSKALAQPEQEPVAWMGAHDHTDLYYRKPPQVDVVPLYTVPPHRKPLTDEEIKRMAAKWFLSMYWPLCNTFARAIEAKLKEKNT